MRTRHRDWDLPSGVVDGDTAAADVAAELAHARAHRGNDPSKNSPKKLGLSAAVPDAAARGRLLERARRGDAAAIKELWDRYRLRLLPGDRRPA